MAYSMGGGRESSDEDKSPKKPNINPAEEEPTISSILHRAASEPCVREKNTCKECKLREWKTIGSPAREELPPYWNYCVDHFLEKLKQPSSSIVSARNRKVLPSSRQRSLPASLESRNSISGFNVRAENNICDNAGATARILKSILSQSSFRRSKQIPHPQHSMESCPYTLPLASSRNITSTSENSEDSFKLPGTSPQSIQFSQPDSIITSGPSSLPNATSRNISSELENLGDSSGISESFQQSIQLQPPQGDKMDLTNSEIPRAPDNNIADTSAHSGALFGFSESFPQTEQSQDSAMGLDHSTRTSTDYPNLAGAAISGASYGVSSSFQQSEQLQLLQGASMDFDHSVFSSTSHVIGASPNSGDWAEASSENRGSNDLRAILNTPQSPNSVRMQRGCSECQERTRRSFGQSANSQYSSGRTRCCICSGWIYETMECNTSSSSSNNERTSANVRDSHDISATVRQSGGSSIKPRFSRPDLSPSALPIGHRRSPKKQTYSTRAKRNLQFTADSNLPTQPIGHFPSLSGGNVSSSSAPFLGRAKSRNNRGFQSEKLMENTDPTTDRSSSAQPAEQFRSLSAMGQNSSSQARNYPQHITTQSSSSESFLGQPRSRKNSGSLSEQPMRRTAYTLDRSSSAQSMEHFLSLSATGQSSSSEARNYQQYGIGPSSISSDAFMGQQLQSREKSSSQSEQPMENTESTVDLGSSKQLIWNFPSISPLRQSSSSQVMNYQQSRMIGSSSTSDPFIGRLKSRKNSGNRSVKTIENTESTKDLTSSDWPTEQFQTQSATGQSSLAQDMDYRPYERRESSSASDPFIGHQLKPRRNSGFRSNQPMKNTETTTEHSCSAQHTEHFQSSAIGQISLAQDMDYRPHERPERSSASDPFIRHQPIPMRNTGFRSNQPLENTETTTERGSSAQHTEHFQSPSAMGQSSSAQAANYPQCERRGSSSSDPFMGHHP